MTKRRKRKLTWRKFEYTMYIPKRLAWSTAKAQQFADLCSDLHGIPRRPIVFDLATKGRGSRYLGMLTADRIRLSLELDTEERWRTLIHEIAHYKVNHHRAKFIEAMDITHELFRSWVKAREGERS